MYGFTTSADERVIDHAEHAIEEWHAYLSSEYPEWVTPDATGVCCHTCSTIIVDVIA